MNMWLFINKRSHISNLYFPDKFFYNFYTKYEIIAKKDVHKKKTYKERNEE